MASPKDAHWAADITGLKAETITTLARRMAAKRTLITIAWSLQRADHGEQSYWMAITLAAMLGQVGLPGGGFGYGYSAVATVGNPVLSYSPGPPWTVVPTRLRMSFRLPRIADLLLNPNAEFDYNGRRATYPDIRLIYWVGGNVFHHHQDLNRLLRAWQKPETVIVHEPVVDAHGAPRGYHPPGHDPRSNATIWSARPATALWWPINRR